MIALDSNILLRLLLNDHQQQAQEAMRAISAAAERKQVCVVSPIVLVELVWVLKSRNITRAEIAGALTSLMEMQELLVMESEAVYQAVNLYADGKADFADYLIWTLSKEGGARSMLSFDRDLCREQKQCMLPTTFLKKIA